MSPRAKHKPEQLSGGQQQRVAVARAVVGNPKLILADEPTGNLDTKNGEEVMNMLNTLNEQGTTIMMVTHSPSHAARAHRIVNLLDGKRRGGEPSRDLAPLLSARDGGCGRPRRRRLELALFREGRNPSMANVRRLRPARLAMRGVALALVAWLVVSVGAVLALRFVPPPFTAMMLEQPRPIRDIQYEWRDRRELAPTIARAVIASEDQRFLAHHGFDFDQLQLAIDEYRAGDELRGASTISQQVAKNVFLWSGRSFVRKGLEAYFTVLIEVCWPKERILEVYLNVAELGDGVFGVEAAARRYFGVNASALSAEQAALLAAVLPNPHKLRVDRPSSYVRGRQAWILEQMKLLETRGHYRGLDW